MQYMLLIYGNEDQPEPAPGTPAFDAYMEPWMTYTEELREAGVMVAGEALQPSLTASCVRMAPGGRQVQDGPFVDSKDQLSGFYMIDVPSLDEAIEWAAKCPGAREGTMEVRPIMVFG
ncbi:YciI family protein [Parvularcula sp. LCG005]|uniref:YciI family protein n=1 Tax=Parvularcula sp. LCG005 TaxID=3078805 RepID=UPI00294352A5|nr:YciI family protein [Parvularcula sp. LCG005]WOI52465.1 YciI family protein [Parvularcula sp. LCG005]